jgi:hypothetical protein
VSTWRVPVVVLVLLACAAPVAFIAFPRAHAAPRSGGVTIRLPDRRPAADAAGAAGWVWPDGVPGWKPGATLKGFNVSGVQPVEVEAAQLAAARHVLDADAVRVVVASRAGTDGVLAIVAAPTLYRTPTQTCLAAVLQGDAPVAWECPGARPHDLAESHVLVAAAAFGAATPAQPGPANALYLVGVARGDVRRVVLVVPGLAPQRLYDRGATWGQFEAAVALHRPPTPPRLLVFSRHGLVETLALDLQPGAQRVFR